MPKLSSVWTFALDLHNILRNFYFKTNLRARTFEVAFFFSINKNVPYHFGVDMVQVWLLKTQLKIYWSFLERYNKKHQYITLVLKNYFFSTEILQKKWKALFYLKEAEKISFAEKRLSSPPKEKHCLFLYFLKSITLNKFA